MQFKVTQKNTRQSPRKVRLVANVIKKLPLEQAIKQLGVIERKSTVVLLKVLKQAIANAKNNHGVDADKLVIKEILVNGGSSYKRYNAVSRGRGHSILKRTSHISVTLEEKLAPKTEAPKAEAVALPAVTEEVSVKAEKVAPKKAPSKTVRKTTKK